MKTDSKIIFFDMGNTLLHFHFGKSDEEKDAAGIIYLTTYLQQFNKKILKEDVKTGFFDIWIKGISSRRIDYVEYPVEGYLNAFLKEYGVQLCLTECIVAMNSFYTDYRDNIWWEDDLPQTLRELEYRGYKIGVISNSRLHDEVMINCFKKAGLVKYIDAFTFSYYLRIAKSRLEIFQIARNKMSVETTNIIMVGDNLESDIGPAQELGWTGIWFNRDGKINKTDIRPNIEICSLNDILDFL